MRTLGSSRVDRLARLRDLVVLGVQRSVDQRTKLAELAKSERIFVRDRDGVGYTYSSIYRYLATLRFVGFDLSEDYSESGRIVWASSAETLAALGQATYRTNELSEAERQVLREQVFSSPVAEQFLSCFCPPGFVPRTYHEFKQNGLPLYVVGRHPQDSSVEISLSPDSERRERRAEQEFLYTYRLWCLDLDIIDELNVREFRRIGILENRKHVLYPVDSGLRPTAKRLIGMILDLARYDNRRPVAIPVPWLMYQICPREQMSVEAVKEAIVDTWKENRDVYHLERAPGVLFDGKLTSERDYSDRYGNHRYYPIVAGTLRSNLVLLPREV